MELGSRAYIECELPNTAVIFNGRGVPSRLIVRSQQLALRNVFGWLGIGAALTCAFNLQ